jgi:adenylate kinase
LNIILFGAPGAGKGTQSSLLISRQKMVQISTGDLFRAAIKNKTPLGKDAQAYMDRGELVPDSIVIGMVEEVLARKPGDVILDGFPRTVNQAEALDGLLRKMQVRLGKAIFLEVPYKTLLMRLTGRRICKGCGAVYHIESKPSQSEGICDSCGGEVVQRSDDREEVIANRLKAYEEFTMPLKNYYKRTGLYVEVNGDQDTEVVYQSIAALIS